MVYESEGLDNNDVFIGIEKIKKHRIIDGVNEYLVKWKGLLEEENSWVSKSEITEEELEDENKRKSHSEIEISRKARLFASLFIALLLAFFMTVESDWLSGSPAHYVKI